MDAGQNMTRTAHLSFQLRWFKKNTRIADSIIIMFISCTQSSISFETFIFLMHKLHRVTEKRISWCTIQYHSAIWQGLITSEKQITEMDVLPFPFPCNKDKKIKNKRNIVIKQVWSMIASALFSFLVTNRIANTFKTYYLY